MTRDIEEWRDIDGFPGYQVSDWGRVRSCRKPGNGEFYDSYTILKPTVGPKGYEAINLYSNGKSHPRRVHRLVMNEFKPSHSARCNEIDHIDCDKRNNCVDNLEWVDSKENSRRARINGLTDTMHRLTVEEIKKGAIAHRKPIIGVNIISKEKKYFDSVTDAANYIQTSVQNVSAVLTDMQKSTCGWVFAYI